MFLTTVHVSTGKLQTLDKELGLNGWLKQIQMKEVTKEYSNGAVTIVWENALCQHSANCGRGLPEVFKPRESPWITPENISTEKIIEQVKKCPSGALSFYLNADKK